MPRTTCASSSGPTSAPAAASARRASSSRARACSRRARTACARRRVCSQSVPGAKPPMGRRRGRAGARGPAPRDVAANLFADCTKSDGDSAPRALAAPVYARMRKGDAPRLRPRGGGLKICPPAGGRIAVEGEGFGGEGGDRLPPIESPTRGRASPAAARAHDAEPAAAAGRAAHRSRRAATTTRTRGPRAGRCRARRRRARGAASASRASRRCRTSPSTARARPCAWSGASAWRCTIRYPWVRLIGARRRRGPSNSLGALPNSRDVSPEGRPQTTMGSPTRSPSPQRPRTTMGVGSPGGW